MSTGTSVVSGTHFEEVMKGVDEETRKQVEDGLVFFSNETDTSAMGEKSRADKLRTAYNNLVEYLVSSSLNELNPHQMAFLCSGAIADSVTIQAAGGPKTVQLLPADFYASLLKTFSAPAPAEV